MKDLEILSPALIAQAILWDSPFMNVALVEALDWDDLESERRDDETTAECAERILAMYN